MLPLPKGSGVVTFVGIDPGTSFPGVSSIQYDVSTRKIVGVSARCLNLARLTRGLDIVEFQTSRFLKIEALRDYLRDLFEEQRPIRIASEHPFINPRRPGAVIPLAECLYAVEQEVYNYDSRLSLEKIDPSSVKKAVGVSGISGDKESMREAIKGIGELYDNLLCDISHLDDNAIDSIAVAYCSLNRELGDYRKE